MDTASLVSTYDKLSVRLLPRLAADTVARNLAKKGVAITPAVKRRLRRWIAGGAKGDFRVKAKGNVEVALSPRDYRRLRGKFERIMTDRVSGIMVGHVFRRARATLAKVRRHWRVEAGREGRAEGAFQRRLSKRWRVPLSLLRLHLHLARDAGSELNDELRTGGRRVSATTEVLTRLHARCCQIAGEVVALIGAGYADGAMARWRSLHEVAIVLQFIAAHGHETARRYLDHSVIESRRAAKQYMLHCARLGYAPYSPAEMNQFEQERNAMVSKHGKDFAEDYGWAAKVLGKPAPTFADIEKAVGLEHWRPFYKLASHGVHANPKGALFKLGLMGNAQLLPVGPTNFGFTDPGHSTAISLGQATAVFLVQTPTPARLLTVQVMTELGRDIGAAFLRVQQRMERG